jgi:hypothetical protein
MFKFQGMKAPNYGSYHRYYFQGMHKHTEVHLSVNAEEALSVKE